MVTIHCYVCGKDEHLSGVVGAPDSPLVQFQKLHPHAKGCGRTRFTCPCGDVHEIHPTNENLIEGSMESTAWYIVHKDHMKAADVPGDNTWTDWL